jgi:hypothetical protein
MGADGGFVMSTSFEVFPTTDSIPSFRQLLDVATAHLGEFLLEYGITQPALLAVTLRRVEPDGPIVPLDTDGPAWWPQDCYAWFHVPGVTGGTDAYACPMDDPGRRSIEDIGAKDLPDFARATTAALWVGRYWLFRRSAGQPAIINIGYGILAGSLAELTDGIVNSDDGAWDYRRLPAQPDVFLRTYFRPELNREWENYNWAKECIAWLPGELSKVRLET